jgi:hypothetical protein
VQSSKQHDSPEKHFPVEEQFTPPRYFVAMQVESLPQQSAAVLSPLQKAGLFKFRQQLSANAADENSIEHAKRTAITMPFFLIKCTAFLFINSDRT